MRALVRRAGGRIAHPPEERPISSRATARVAAWTALIASLAFCTGCPAFYGLFGTTSGEQTQLTWLRGMQHAVSPLTNQELGYALKGVNEVLSLGLGTFYGIDLTPYLGSVPWPALPKRNSSSLAQYAGSKASTCDSGANPNPQDPDKEIGSLASADQRELMLFNFSGNPPQDKSLSYSVLLCRSLENITGNLDVQTTTRTSFQKHVPAAPNQPFVFGRNWTTSQPSDLSASLSLARGNQLGSLQVSLSADQSGSSSKLLNRISISGTLPRISLQLSGRVQSGTINLTGKLTLSDDQGNKQALDVTTLSLTSDSMTLSLVGSDQQLAIDLSFDGGKLSGEARSTNSDLSRSLAEVNSDSGKTQIKYRDKSDSETWQ